MGTSQSRQQPDQPILLVPRARPTESPDQGTRLASSAMWEAIQRCVSVAEAAWKPSLLFTQRLRAVHCPALRLKSGVQLARRSAATAASRRRIVLQEAGQLEDGQQQHRPMRAPTMPRRHLPSGSLLAVVACVVACLDVAASKGSMNKLVLKSSSVAFGSTPQHLALETQLWSKALSTVMGGVKGVTWSLRWDDLGLPAGPDLPELRSNRNLNGKESQLLECVNAKTELRGSQTMTWEAAMGHDELGAIQAVGAWWSNPPDLAAPATVVTAGSVSRLPQLYAQCKSWNGPLSVALYQPLLASASPGLDAENQAQLRAAVLVVSQFVADMQATASACKPDVLLVWEMYSDERAIKLLYPVNILRNLARLQARTPLMALVDVDLVLSRSLSERLENKTRTDLLMEEAIRGRTVFVIPAFDVQRGVERTAWADALVSGDKETMVYALKRGLVFQFDLAGFPQGHNTTDYQRWIASDADYSVEAMSEFEPWIVGPRMLLPWHDARYMGYGYNKIQFIANINANRFSFKVLSDAFTIHRAHKPAAAAGAFINNKHAKKQTNRPNLYTHNLMMFQQQLTLHRKRQPFVAPLNPATLNCMSTLPWWEGVSRGMSGETPRGE